MTLNRSILQVRQLQAELEELNTSYENLTREAETYNEQLSATSSSLAKLQEANRKLQKTAEEKDRELKKVQAQLSEATTSGKRNVYIAHEGRVAKVVTTDRRFGSDEDVLADSERTGHVNFKEVVSRSDEETRN